MQARLDYAKAAPGGFEALLGMHKYLMRSGLEGALLELVWLRASQINGCAFCIHMHWQDLRKKGVSEQQLYMLTAWREWSGYTERERAALEWTEALTMLTEGHVPDDVFRTVREQFTEVELANLSYAVVLINSFNRLSVAFRRQVAA